MKNDNDFLNDNKHIPTLEVLNDIVVTEKEIKYYLAQIIINPRLKISYIKGIKEREDFIIILKRLLKLRGME